jgi:large subunit ribosomal protein L22
MQYRASSRYVHVAPSKARQVVAHIRGQAVPEAQRILRFSPKAVSDQVLKTLNSAVANAGHLEDLRATNLIVASAVVEEGPTIKRFQPRAMGRAYRIRKRTCHITITVEPANDEREPRSRGRSGGRSRTSGATGAAGKNEELRSGRELHKEGKG